MEDAGESKQRTCGRCGANKPVSEFAVRRRASGQLDNYCRPCRRDYGREHYLENREAYVRNAARRRARVLGERVEWLLDYLRDHPCVDCGEPDVTVLEFDHLRDKRFSISRGVRDRNWDDVLEELEKCEVVCANCHRRRTARRGEFLRATMAGW